MVDSGNPVEQDLYLDVAGAKLQCQISRSTNTGAGPVSSSVGLVVFHPWSWLGGCMDDAVVASIYRTAQRSGQFNTVLRYNVRGNGGSTGWKAMGGAQDVKDVIAICRYILTELYNPPTELYFVAYSYGSCIAASALQHCPQVAGYVSVAFPLGRLSQMFLRSRTHWEALLASRVPKFLVVGSSDQFTSLQAYNSLVYEYRRKCAAEARGAQMDVRVLEGCDHFFGGKWQEVADDVVHWVAAREAIAQVVGGDCVSS